MLITDVMNNHVVMGNATHAMIVYRLFILYADSGFTVEASYRLSSNRDRTDAIIKWLYNVLVS